MIEQYKIMPEQYRMFKLENKTFEETQKIIRTNISSVEWRTGLRLKKIKGLVNGKPTFASTFIFEKEV